MKFKVGDEVFYKDITYTIVQAGCKIKANYGWVLGYAYKPHWMPATDPMYIREAQDFESKFRLAKKRPENEIQSKTL